MNRASYIAILIFAVSFALKLPYLASYYDVANLDEANIGVMAMDILRGHIPIFMYGHNYFGPLEALFIAGGLLVFPNDPLTLRMAIVVMSILSTFFVWRAARLLLDENGALMALAWFAIPPVILVIWSILPSGGHIAGLLTSSVIIYLTARIIRYQTTSNIFYFFFGIIIGFSLWNHPGNLICVIAAAIIIILANWRILRSWAIPVSLAGCVIGGAPFWLSILRNIKVIDFGQSASSGPGWNWDALANGFSESIRHMPLFLGYQLLPPFLEQAALGLLEISLLASLVFMVKGAMERSRAALLPLFGWLLIAGALSAYVLINADKYQWIQYRYYLPIIIALAFVLGYTFQKAYSKTKTGAIAIAFCLILLNAGISVYAYASGSYHAYRMDTRLDDRFFTYKNLIPALEELNINTAYVRFLDDTSIVYETNGKITASAYSGSRLKEYSRMVDASYNPAFVLEDHNLDAFEAALTATLAGYKKKRVNPYTIFYDIKPPSAQFVPIPRESIKISGKPHGQDAWKALDGDFDTLWNSQKMQSGDEFLTLDFGEPVDISRIDLISSWESDMPSYVVVELSMDKQKWTKVAQVPNIGALYWAGPHLLFKAPDGFNQYIFKTEKARYARIRQIGAAGRHWHVREIYLYKSVPVPKETTQDIDWNKTIAFLENEKIKRVIGDVYFSANVFLKSDGDIWANLRENNLNKDPLMTIRDFAIGDFDAIATHERELPQIKRYMDRQGFGYKTKIFGKYHILYRIITPAVLAQELGPDRCKATEHESLLCDFGKSVPLAGFKLAGVLAKLKNRISGPVKYSDDGLEWTQGPTPQIFYPKIRWTGSHIIGENESDTYTFPRLTTRYLTIPLTNQSM